MALPDLPKIVMSNICGPFSKKSVFEKLEIEISAVDPHSFYADPDPTVFLTANPDPDPDPDPGPGPDEPNLKKKNHKQFSQVVKNIKDCSIVRNNGACANLLLKSLKGQCHEKSC